MHTSEHHTNRYFVGMKVEVDIPLQSTKSFRDWAIINEIDEDLVSLQLSRDILPEGVNLRIGQVLTITSQSDGATYTCRAFIVSKGYEQDLLLRFTNETIYNQFREFYRVDAFLPIRFHALNDQNPADAREQWNERRKQRRDEEEARERRRLVARRIRQRIEERLRTRNVQGNDFINESASAPGGTIDDELHDNQYYESWGDITTPAVNISGGGLRIFTQQKFSMDELVLLETYIPSAQRIVDIVARVVFTSYIGSEDDAANRSTAMQFVCIEESARSAMNAHISTIQLKRIRQFKGFTDVEPVTNNDTTSPNKHYAFIDTVDGGEKHDSSAWKLTPKTQKILLSVSIACATCLLCFYFYRYAIYHPKNEIQEMFENNFTKYRTNVKQQ
jgi:hypothetical protein